MQSAFSIKVYFDQKMKPEAVIFAADSYAYLFWEAALEGGLRVPEEEEREGLDVTSHGESAYHL